MYPHLHLGLQAHTSTVIVRRAQWLLHQQRAGCRAVQAFDLLTHGLLTYYLLTRLRTYALAYLGACVRMYFCTHLHTYLLTSYLLTHSRIYLLAHIRT